MILRLANRSDDRQLRQLMRETVVPGHIRMAYTREPDFFKAYEATGDDTQVVVAEDNGEIVGVGCRSIRKMIVNGQATEFGYLSGLRLKPCARNAMTLARGYAFLKELHEDNRVPAYLTTIIEGNDHAQSMLTGGRAGLPAYVPMGRYLTGVIPVPRQSKKPGGHSDIDVKAASDVSGLELTEFLREQGASRQFFPLHNCNGQRSGVPHATGLDNILVATRVRDIAGTMSVWDQGSYKQNIVYGYSGWLRATRPLLNLALVAKGLHALPRAGERIRYGVAGMLCVREDDVAVFRLLLRHALAHAANRGLQLLAVGLHEQDPLATVMREFRHVPYWSGLYLVAWDADVLREYTGDSRVPYLELGTL